jgi:cobalt/nickel transport system permease protein
MVAAVLCALELAASGTYAWGDVMAAMAGVHAMVGLCEALITAAVLLLVTRLASLPHAAWIGFAAAMALVALSPWASSSPDGLESVAARLGFSEHATTFSLATPWSDYAVASGLVGALAVFAAAWCMRGTVRQASSA